MLPGETGRAAEPGWRNGRPARVLAGYRRTASDRGRGQARPFGLSDLAAVLATCPRPRRRGRGVEPDQVALKLGRVDTVIAGLLFMAGMRRSQVGALRWADVAEATDGDGMLVTVRRSKTNQEGEVNDVRFVKDGVRRALQEPVAGAGGFELVVGQDLERKLEPAVQLLLPLFGKAAGVELVGRRGEHVPTGTYAQVVGARGSSRPAGTTQTILPATTTVARLCADALVDAERRIASPSGFRPGFFGATSRASAR